MKKKTRPKKDPVPKTIKQAEAAVQRRFAAALASATLDKRRTLCELERELWVKLLALGRALVALFFLKATQRPRAATYEHDGEPYVLAAKRTTEVGTRFGKVPFRRRVGRRVGARRRGCDRPIDRELGLGGGFSLSVMVDIVRLCALLPFATARDAFAEFCAWCPSPRAVLRMVDALGGQARSFLEQAPAPEGDGEVLVIQVDGKGAPAISSRERRRRARPRRATKGKSQRHQRRSRRREQPRVRRKPGHKSKNAKVAVLGVIYTLKRNDEGQLDGPVNKRAIATFSTHRALFEWLHAEAVKRGYGTDKFERVHFLADGADAIWALQQEFFPKAEVGLDWYHVSEKLWAAGKCLHRKNRRMVEEWVVRQKKRLRSGSFDALMTELRVALEDTPRTGPGNKYRRTVLGAVIHHFDKNRGRMKYARLRRLDLDIATGVVEGAVRHIIGTRFDGPGMRWGLDRLERLLHLRCILVNDMWDEFVHYLVAKPQIRLAPQPLPARTHDAVAKQAA
ncbi:MAG: hypothetical protein KC776_40270 [Myxococcales bacterium]|nr:hypothetical protein [Myxococcales bacterium]